MSIRNKLSTFYNRTKQKGLKYAIRETIRGFVGLYEMEELREQIRTMHYFLNELHSPSEISQTRDRDLRIMQECDAVLLEIFHKFCQKHQLTYWLDYGTLLGAERHNGFIPWDDDMDVAMLRSDYDKFCKLTHEELSNFGIEAVQDSGRIGFSYRHQETGIWLDIFPVDELQSSLCLKEVEPLINERIEIYRNFYSENIDLSILAEKRDEIINKNIQHGSNRILYHGPEFIYTKNVMHQASDIFPLGIKTFEGREFPVPARVGPYLENIYGNHYMEFPKSGILHHGEATGRPPLSKWAGLHHINMQDVFSTLLNISMKI